MADAMLGWVAKAGPYLVIELNLHVTAERLRKTDECWVLCV
jgi:hypothetical protein